MDDIKVCPVCRQEVNREDMRYTKDCQGITYRRVCCPCYEEVMRKGYDGEYYTSADENVDDDY